MKKFLILVIILFVVYKGYQEFFNNDKQFLYKFTNAQKAYFHANGKYTANPNDLSLNLKGWIIVDNTKGNQQVCETYTFCAFKTGIISPVIEKVIMIKMPENGYTAELKYPCDHYSIVISHAKGENSFSCEPFGSAKCVRWKNFLKKARGEK